MHKVLFKYKKKLEFEVKKDLYCFHQLYYISLNLISYKEITTNFICLKCALKEQYSIFFNLFYNLKKVSLHHLYKLSYLFDPLAKAQKIEILKEPKKKANAFGEFARVRTYSRVVLLSKVLQKLKRTITCSSLMNFICY